MRSERHSMESRVAIRSRISWWHCIDLKSVSDHHSHFCPVFGLWYNAGASSELIKCFLFDDNIDYLRRPIEPLKLFILDKATNVIRGLRHPTNLKEFELFISLCNMFHRFVRILPESKPRLTRSLRKISPSPWRSRRNVTPALRMLQAKLLSLLLFELLGSTGPCTLDRNACDRQMGHVLLQEKPDVPQSSLNISLDSQTRVTKHTSKLIVSLAVV